MRFWRSMTGERVLEHRHRRLSRAFVFGIFTFVCQTLAATWVIKGNDDAENMEGYGITITVMVAVAMIAAAIYLTSPTTFHGTCCVTAVSTSTVRWRRCATLA